MNMGPFSLGVPLVVFYRASFPFPELCFSALDFWDWDYFFPEATFPVFHVAMRSIYNIIMLFSDSIVKFFQHSQLHVDFC